MCTSCSHGLHDRLAAQKEKCSAILREDIPCGESLAIPVPPTDGITSIDLDDDEIMHVPENSICDPDFEQEDDAQEPKFFPQ